MNDTAPSRMPRWLAPILAVVGPAVVMTAGIMGPGSTTSLLLSGTYFRYDLLWAAIISLPAIVVCLDSGARVGIMSGGKGMLSVIRDEIHPAVTWFVLLVMVAFNLFVNMGMFSMMTACAMSLAGYYPPGADASAAYVRGYGIAEAVLAVVFALVALSILLTGSYKRVQKLMAGLLLFVFICYFVVAVRGLQEFPAILTGLWPRIPENLPVPDTDRVRDAYWQMISIVGGGLAAAPILSFSYFTVDDKARPENMPKYFWKAVLTLGCLYGLFCVLVIVAGGFALYRLPNHASIQSVHEAGQVLTHALPGSLGALGPKIFAIGLFTCAFNTMVVVSQLMCYFCLDGVKRDWHYTRDNQGFRWLLTFWVLVPALLSTFWEFPALLKMVLLMGLNAVIVPMAIIIILYLVNRKSVMKEHRANFGRNVFLVASLVLALWLAYSRAPQYVRDISKELKPKTTACIMLDKTVDTRRL